MASKTKQEYAEFEVWTVTCLLCGEELYNQDKIPPAFARKEHMKIHGINPAVVSPDPESYTREVEGDERGEHTVTASMVHATDFGKGQHVVYAVCMRGKVAT